MCLAISSPIVLACPMVLHRLVGPQTTVTGADTADDLQPEGADGDIAEGDRTGRRLSARHGGHGKAS
jgi:hypothetical protein